MASIYLIGVRGIPNRYGGFERLVEVLAPHLVSQGHAVTVFCEGNAPDDLWQGVHRRHVPVDGTGPRATLQYDWRSFARVPRGAIALVFGYGTALFQLQLRLRGVPVAVNMDGIEWQRAKWGRGARAWLRLNEHIAARTSTALIADHPSIQSYLRSSFGAASTMIAYGVDPNVDTRASHPLLDRFGPGGYLLAIARAEPENQTHVLLQAHEAAGRPHPLLIVGNFDATPYGRALKARHPHAVFAGPVYDAAALNALRHHALLYLHGHSVGGTNPSLIEAMAAGAAVVAHDNPFNRWVMGDDGGWFFRDAPTLANLLRQVPAIERRQQVVAAAQAACRERFLWPDILAAYDGVVQRLIDRR